MNYQFKRGRSFCERVTLLAGVKFQDYFFVMAEVARSTPTKAMEMEMEMELGDGRCDSPGHSANTVPTL